MLIEKERKKPADRSAFTYTGLNNAMKDLTNKVFICIALLITLTGCSAPFSEEDELKLYNAVLDEIIYNNYFQFCLSEDSLQKIDKEFSSEFKQTSRYLKIVDSLKTVRREKGPKCTIDYTERLGTDTKESMFSDDIKFSIQDNLKDTFVVNHFINVSAEDVFNKLSRPARLDLNELRIGYMNIVPHDKSEPYGNGIGLIAISDVYLNEDLDKGILYYEFNCGPLCGHGQLVFIGKQNGAWKILKYMRIWDS